jgi:hypothetical protein
MVPLLELQRRQQMATLNFFLKGPSLLKCSIVAPEAPIACGYCFIKIPQYTQVLSLARISRSSCLEIPYVLDMVLVEILSWLEPRTQSWLSETANYPLDVCRRNVQPHILDEVLAPIRIFLPRLDFSQTLLNLLLS